MPCAGGCIDHQLERGRELYAEREWSAAFASMAAADRATPLEAGDLELLATSAYLIGRDDAQLSCLERAYHLYLAAGESPRAVRCAFWLGIHLTIRGETSRATGWFGRARRMLERDERECAERGYLLVADAFLHLNAGDWAAAYDATQRALLVGERFGEPDLLALAGIDQGRALAGLGRVTEGVRLLDEVMVAVVAGELSPVVTGLAYCAVIDGCHATYEVRRAQEWTAALTRWCEGQPDLVSFTGTCLLHRAEIMQLRGGWHDALEEARRAGERLAQRMSPSGVAQAHYREGELLRLQGQFAAAEDAYREASRRGWEPQPGLALLRLAQGDGATAAATMRRALAEATAHERRASLLPACVEVMLAVDDIRTAREAAHELGQVAAEYPGGLLRALAAQARGAIELADGHARAALVALREAFTAWQELEAPYESARVRELIGRACAALGDSDAAAMELEAARAEFERLGAVPDLARMASAEPSSGDTSHGLTARELEVLRLVAGGLSNKAIASQLVLSERTVHRHISNIFAKLHLKSRAAATAFAYRNELV